MERANPILKSRGWKRCSGEFRHNRPAPEFPEFAPAKRFKFLSWRMGRFPALATAAAAVAAIVVLLHRAPTIKPAPATVAGWEVSRVEGTPRIGNAAVSGKEGMSRFAVGQMLETDPQSRASLQSEDTGQIEVDPSTRLRLLTMNAGMKRVALDRGTIHAYIWAPPGQFVVDTPSATTVDLGCAYTLHVDDSGVGLVRTSLGWVGFKLNGHESFIPAGAACATRPKVGPGTPYFEDAAADFRALWRGLILRTALPSNARRIWRPSWARLASATPSHCGICWLEWMSPSAPWSTTGLLSCPPARRSHEGRDLTPRSADARSVVERTRV